MKLLLHTCCAPCSVYCIKTLRADDIEPTLYWYNPNIHPYQEYKARRDCLRTYAKTIKVDLREDDAYGLDEFVRCTADKITNRCQEYCYPKRLRQAYEYAKAEGFDAISTTLLYSIYQQHDFVKELMTNLSAEYGIEFVYHDFREGWKEGQDEARRIGLYMQKYCGCVFSEEESFLGREIARKLQKQGVSPTNANVRKILEANKIDNIVRPDQLLDTIRREFQQE